MWFWPDQSDEILGRGYSQINDLVELLPPWDNVYVHGMRTALVVDYNMEVQKHQLCCQVVLFSTEVLHALLHPASVLVGLRQCALSTGLGNHTTGWTDGVGQFVHPQSQVVTQVRLSLSLSLSLSL